MQTSSFSFPMKTLSINTSTFFCPRKHFSLFAVVLIWVCASPCQAALGGNHATVVSEQQAWRATLATSALPGATLYRLTLGNGVMVREYLNSEGTVFAVGWEGPVLPDLRRMLAGYFANYQKAVRSQQHGVRLNTPELVLESGGRMRAFIGRAYLPASVPAGINVNDIQ